MIFISTIKRNYFLFRVILLSCFFIPQYIHASIFDDFSLFNFEQNSGVTLQQQGGRSWTGGSFNLHAKNTTLKPFDVKAPGFSAGCGGISFDFGGFSMMDMESLGKFLESMVQQAPGYFVELALQILCPSCLDIMNTLQEMAQALNGLNFDSCATLTAVGNSIKGAVSNRYGSAGNYSSLEKTVSQINHGISWLADQLKTFVGCANSANFLDPNSSCFVGNIFLGNMTIAMLSYNKLQSDKSPTWEWFKASKILPSAEGETDIKAQVGFLAALFGDAYFMTVGQEDESNTQEDLTALKQANTDANLTKEPINDKPAQQSENPTRDSHAPTSRLPSYGSLGLAQNPTNSKKGVSYESLFFRMLTGGTGVYESKASGDNTQSVKNKKICTSSSDNNTWSFDYYIINAKMNGGLKDGKESAPVEYGIENKNDKAIFVDLSNGATAMENLTKIEGIDWILKTANHKVNTGENGDALSSTDRESKSLPVCAVVSTQINNIVKNMLSDARVPIKITNRETFKRLSGSTQSSDNPELDKDLTKMVQLSSSQGQGTSGLSQDDLNFIAMFSFPFFKLLNKLSINNDSLLQFAEKGVAYMSALALNELIKEITEAYSYSIAEVRSRGSHINIDYKPEEALLLTQSLKEARMAIGNVLAAFGAEQFYKDIQTIAKNQRMDNILKLFMTTNTPVGFGDIIPGTGF